MAGGTILLEHLHAALFIALVLQGFLIAGQHILAIRGEICVQQCPGPIANLRPSVIHQLPRAQGVHREPRHHPGEVATRLPDAGLVLSSREPAELRDGLHRIGITHTSAGSHTEPGGYEHPGEAQEQFEVSDTRSPEEVAGSLRAMGYEPVWEDPSLPEGVARGLRAAAS